MGFRSFNSELRIGKRTVMQIEEIDNLVLASNIGVEQNRRGKIILYANDKPVGEVVLEVEALVHLTNGGKLKTKSVNQFRKSIK
jgi:hypothetical protein